MSSASAPDRETDQTAASSPVMAQFHALKRAHPGTLLFFRMGDFYELFFDDAVAAAEALDIALTKRGRDRGEDIPMCGVPAHNAEPYLHRLIRKGFRVAIADQMEDPAEARKRPGKSIVHRDVVRIVTPGTLTEDGLLEPGRHNFLVALARGQQGWGAAWIDISSGEFLTEPVDEPGLGSLLARLDPGEILVPERLFADEALRARLQDWNARLTPVRDTSFDTLAAETRLRAVFAVAAVEAFGSFSRGEIAAAGALLDYVELTQKGTLPRLARPRRIEPTSILRLDPATRRNLELVQGPTGGREGSLLGAIDRTRTGAGARLLAERLAAPLALAPAIVQRLDEVEALLEDAERREALRELLRRCPDLERALQRLTLDRGGPRDLASIAQGLDRAAAARDLLAQGAPPLAAFAAGLPSLAPLIERLQATLIDEPPLLARDGGFVRPGADPGLDELRRLRDQARQHMLELEARYREQSGIGSLKIRHNHQLGWYIEITSTHRAKVPEGFVQRQSMATATRYTTAELGELEGRIGSAAEQALALELAVFAELRAALLAESEAVAATAETLAAIDVTAALAELARAERLVRPAIDTERRLRIKGGRHLVVEQALAREHKPFAPNDLDLDTAKRLWLLTGPNMAGKSTFLRQNALIVLMAQMGSFVPASSATIGVVDRVFSRVGAADDLARGRSTFMVEMVETATILHQAGERSFVILDEIGRGTATWDGLSLAWAVIEHLHEVNGALGLFATHYHELTALAKKLRALAVHTMKVKEWQGEVIFLHEVGPGTADRSYGIHVARLAGLPQAVIDRATTVLRRLEQGEPRSAPAQLVEDLPLFAAALPKPPPPPGPSPAEMLLATIDPDELTPKRALELLYELKAVGKEPGKRRPGSEDPA